MKNLFIALCILLTTAGNLTAQEPVKIGSDAVQEYFYTTIPEELKNKQWNRWTTKNFVICSISDGQAQYLHSNLNKIKEWLLSRWGFADFDFGMECRVICVDDPALFKKMFGIDKSKVEIKDKILVMFLLLDDKPAKTIPFPLTEACLIEFEKSNYQLPWWFHRSMGILNGSIPDVRKELTELQPILAKDTPMFFSTELANMTEEKYNKLTAEQKNLFDKNSLAFTLMIRKELGQKKLHQFLQSKNIGDLGFVSSDQLDATFKAYMIDLTNDVVGANKKMTPDSYFQIKKD